MNDFNTCDFRNNYRFNLLCALAYAQVSACQVMLGMAKATCLLFHLILGRVSILPTKSSLLPDYLLTKIFTVLRGSYLDVLYLSIWTVIVASKS